MQTSSSDSIPEISRASATDHKTTYGIRIPYKPPKSHPKATTTAYGQVLTKIRLLSLCPFLLSTFLLSKKI